MYPPSMVHAVVTVLAAAPGRSRSHPAPKGACFWAHPVQNRWHRPARETLTKIDIPARVRYSNGCRLFPLLGGPPYTQCPTSSARSKRESHRSLWSLHVQETAPPVAWPHSPRQIPSTAWVGVRLSGSARHANLKPTGHRRPGRRDPKSCRKPVPRVLTRVFGGVWSCLWYVGMRHAGSMRCSVR